MKETSVNSVGMFSRKRKKRRIASNDPLPTPKVFQNEDLMGEIVEYLDGKSILFAMVYVSKMLRPRLTYQHAVHCAMATAKGGRRMRSLATLIRKGCIYTPSPMRILRLGMGKRCERCNTTKTNTINSLGLFLCRSCTNGIVSEIKFHEGRAEESCALVRAAIEDERCAKRVQRFRRKKRPKYYLYSGVAPFVDGAGEKSGPHVSLISLSNLTAAAFSKTCPSPKVFDKFFGEARADDLHRSKIPSILKAIGVVRYCHLGILDRMGPRTRWNHSSDWKVLIRWANGERTWESLALFAEDDFDTCVSYAKNHGLFDTKGWEGFRR
mmetsp:Transcript_22193/g.54956  ORF Transcript_22193/g.54956 Transcript_22193/m.54956 type:complete len:324 (+) Transcript_22193:589-1560(+)